MIGACAYPVSMDNRKHRIAAGISGVNLGNWLVLEKWMSPSVFADADGAEDEYSLSRNLAHDDLVRRLEAHRDTYITEGDFARLAAEGIDTVRLPVPFFLFGSCPPYIGCISYVDKAFAWANRYGLKILLDLHTVPGSQNGFDNGGQIGVISWHTSHKDIAFALSVLDRMARRYGRDTALLGIEVLNEPKLPMRFLKRFYATAYIRLRRILPPEKAIVFHDGFNLPGIAAAFLADRRFRSMDNVYVDTHVYLTFTEQKIERFLNHTPGMHTGHTPRERYRQLLYTWGIGLDKLFIRSVDKIVPVIAGEWCAESSVGKLQANAKGIAEASRFTSFVAQLHREAFPRQFFWSYQIEKDPARRDSMRGTWKEFWDWRMCHDAGII